MSEINTGGPAFPVVGEHFKIKEVGMTLRDYFAAKAMAAMCGGGPAPRLDELEYIANRSYDVADSMLKAREK